MKIAIWHNLPSGGGKRALYNHVVTLKERGHQIEAWTTDIAASDYLPLSNLVKENRKNIKTDYENILNIKNPIIREKKIAKLLNTHSNECMLDICSKNFDVLFANSCSISYMPFIGKYAKIPSLVYLGEPYRPLYEAMPENIWKARYIDFKWKKIKGIIRDFKINYSFRLKVFYEIQAAKSYNQILVNSLFSRENIIRSYGIEPMVCYLGVNDNQFFNERLEKEPYIISMGSMSFSKGAHKAIEILAKIDKLHRPTLVWVANSCDENYYKQVKRLAREKHVNFQYYENIDDDVLKKLLAKAAVFLYLPRMEPFGLAPLEGNACGTYTVAIAEGGVRESICDEKNGKLFSQYKPEIIAKELEKYTSDLEYATNKGIIAKEFVSNNWAQKNMADNIENALKELMLNRNK